ncbi:chemotaxis protein CheW [Roseicyclus mahoneyensis]|uniref:Chemotaxis protein CheW n=1 Tax=Roseicyclus mahoneyensis TaxID=164332 RepID=A0A316GIE6_9RHOB|nr:chemotaxis protein CheW [Roseicyclus mahoneyensis]PWK60385.1 purine-binding chemotaxis protein CheW [Roseicyclus mahoneyensis]
MTQTQTQTPPPNGGLGQAMAAEADHEDTGIDTMYLTFPVGDETYGVPITLVTEIVGMQRVMSVPDVPHYIRGVINLRGKVIPLMDVRLRFGMAERAYDDRTVVIVLDVGNAPVGLIVDGVSEVVDIPADRLDRAAGFGGDGTSVVQALGHVGDRVAILLDVPVLVSDVEVMRPAMADA